MAIKKEFLKVKVSELVPYENNPRINEPAVADTMESIKQCENLDPIEVDENMVILSGHTRMLAMQRLGIAETEVVKYSGLTEDQKKKYRILANKTQELAQWDFEKLQKELDGLDFDGFDFGFDFSRLDGMAEQMSAPEPVFTPNGVSTAVPQGEVDPYLPEGFDDAGIEDYVANQESYIVKKRVIITYLPEQEPELKALLGVNVGGMKVVYDITELQINRGQENEGSV